MPKTNMIKLATEATTNNMTVIPDNDLEPLPKGLNPDTGDNSLSPNNDELFNPHTYSHLNDEKLSELIWEHKITPSQYAEIMALKKPVKVKQVKRLNPLINDELIEKYSSIEVLILLCGKALNQFPVRLGIDNDDLKIELISKMDYLDYDDFLNSLIKLRKYLSRPCLFPNITDCDSENVTESPLEILE